MCVLHGGAFRESTTTTIRKTLPQLATRALHRLFSYLSLRPTIFPSTLLGLPFCAHNSRGKLFRRVGEWVSDDALRVYDSPRSRCTALSTCSLTPLYALCRSTVACLIAPLPFCLHALNFGFFVLYVYFFTGPSPLSTVCAIVYSRDNHPSSHCAVCCIYSFPLSRLP